MLRITLKKLDPMFKGWQIYFKCGYAPEMFQAFDIKFGIVKILGFSPRGELSQHGRHWKGFSHGVRIVYGDYAPSLYWRNRNGMRRLFFIPLIWTRKGL